MDLPTGASRFVFILAHPAGHVVAPRYYTPFFQGAGLDWHMVPLDIAPENLSDTIRALAKSTSVVGINLTMPHKPAAYALCDEVGPAAEFEGVVNTIRIESNGRLVGDSFDGGGFLDAARAKVSSIRTAAASLSARARPGEPSATPLPPQAYDASASSTSGRSTI